MGEDPNREGLLKTPLRTAKALMFFTSGYGLRAEQVLNEAIFSEVWHISLVPPPPSLGTRMHSGRGRVLTHPGASVHSRTIRKWSL